MDVKIMAYGRVIEKRLSQTGFPSEKSPRRARWFIATRQENFFPLVILSFDKEKEFQLLVKGEAKSAKRRTSWPGRWNKVPFSAFSVEN